MLVFNYLLFFLLLISTWVYNWEAQHETSEVMDLSRHLATPIHFRLTAPYLVGQVSFQTPLDFSVEFDEDKVIYISSSDGGFGMVVLPKPVDYFEQSLIPFDNGGRFPEESIPIDMFYNLGYVNIKLESIRPYWHDGFRGHLRSFVARSDLGDLMEGEYLFYDVGDNVLFVIGSSVQEGLWGRSKPAFDVIVTSIHFPFNHRPIRPMGGLAVHSGNLGVSDHQVNRNPMNLSYIRVMGFSSALLRSAIRRGSVPQK
jgi:hypothetical protein